jgi:hypothetical protein
MLKELLNALAIYVQIFFLFVCVNDAIYSLPGYMNQEKKKE